MAAVKEIFRFLDSIVPFDTQMNFDNAGFLVGRGDRSVSKVLVSLDITPKVVEEAEQWGAELIVSHHPVIFHPARSVTDETVTGRILLRLVEGGIAAICAHTNLDTAEGGVNDALAARLGLVHVEKMEGGDGILRVGAVKEIACSAFAAYVKEALNAGGVRFIDTGRPVERIAVGGGACGGYLHAAVKAGCDALVTSDVKYDLFLEAKALGLALIDAGHFPTEDVVCPVLERALKEHFPELEVRISAVHREVMTYL